MKQLGPWMYIGTLIKALLDIQADAFDYYYAHNRVSSDAFCIDLVFQSC